MASLVLNVSQFSRKNPSKPYFPAEPQKSKSWMQLGIIPDYNQVGTVILVALLDAVVA